MYDFTIFTDIFEIFEAGLANSHILFTNHLATPKLAIFEQWRPDWRSGGRQFANLAIFANILPFSGYINQKWRFLFLVVN